MKEQGVVLPIIIVLLITGIFVGALVVSKLTGRANPVQEVTQKATKVITGGGGFDFDEDTPGHENYKKLIQGCPFKDCILSIDNPKFESVKEADSWLEDTDVVFALEHKNKVRGYPQRILNWHEIVNDEISGDFLVITFCPLCGSALVFDRQVEGPSTGASTELSRTSSGREPLVLEFGVSGKLHNNDLVMYDRQSESLWQQITGEAIVGKYFGKRLKQIPMSGMRWSQFKKEFPKGEVLSRDTGFSRGYDVYPYGDYEKDASPLFPVEGGVDSTIHPKTVVYGVELNSKYKAYPEDKIANAREIKDKIGGIQIQVLYNNGDVLVKRLDTSEEILATRLFWFAWKAFRPETELY